MCESLICGKAVTSRLGCWFALKVTRSGCVAWHSWRHPIFYFFFPLRQPHTDRAAIYKACVQPFVSAQMQPSSNCHRWTDWLCIMSDSLLLLSLWSQRSKPRWYTTMTVIGFDLSKASKHSPVPHTLSHPVDPVLLRSGGKHSDGIIHSETEILSWSMEPSTVKFTVATSAPIVYNVTGLSCANWHFSVHKSPKKKKKKLQAAPISEV